MHNPDTGSLNKLPRIAIIGAGSIGKVHARLIASPETQGVLSAVVDIIPERAEKLASQYGVPAYRSAAEAYAAEKLDIASICVPSAYHADTTVEALEAGLHVIVEKPIDVTLEAADRILAAERAHGKTVSVISQRRFQPAAAYIHNAIARGDLGRVTSASVESAFFRSQSYYDSGDWRGTLAIDGGGALMNQGIHALDLMIWMLGTPVSVSAHAGCLAHKDIEVEDVTGATIAFQNGAIGVILASTAAYPGLPVRLSVHGAGGSAVMEDDRLTYFRSETAVTPDAAETAERDIPEGWSEVDVAHRRQWADLLDAVAKKRPPAITTSHGRRALQVVLAVYESARTGQPVTLPI